MGNSCGVYVIQNKVNGKVYVGSSVAAKPKEFEAMALR